MCLEIDGIVQGEDGKPLTRFIPGDPGVINDDGRIYLYYGWSLALPPEHKAALPMTQEPPMYENMIQLQMMMFDKSRDEVVGEKEGVMGANVVELKEDMLTTVTEPKRIVPGQFNASGDFTAVAVYFNLETTAQFDSSNKLPNQFVENILWSAKNNSADVPTDCPTRERHGWAGDSQLFAVTAGYLI